MSNSGYEMSIVIPCYNEESMFLYKEYHAFIQSYPQVALCFVNDGSTDGTLGVLQSLEQQYSNVHLYDMPQNSGKAEAVRQGMLRFSKEITAPYVAFLDADLAVSLEECYLFREEFTDNIEFVFGSRIARIGAEITRSRFRFLVGRVIATFISTMLGLKVYDTQCGAKAFKKEVIEELFNQRFLSKWLFDVELFFRMIQKYDRVLVKQKLYEIPLRRWFDRGDSKVSVFYFFKLWWDLLMINREYK